MTELTDDDARALVALRDAHQDADAAADDARERYHAALERHRRAGVPVAHLAVAVDRSRVRLHEILKARGVKPDRAAHGGDRSNPPPAPAFRVRAALRGLGIDTSGSLDAIADAVRERLSEPDPGTEPATT